MSQSFRDSKFDLVLVAGPRTDPWPSVGVRTLSKLAADYSLEVAWVGGNDLQARGVIPLPGTGGIVMAQDIQGRIHRLQARSVVKWKPLSEIPDPFEGSYSSGLVPGSTGLRLFREGTLSWEPAVALLGSSNRAFRLGTQLLEKGCPEVYIVETFAQWGGKRFAGWEVEKRRFETLGGKLIEANPVSLRKKSALIWEFRMQDPRGIRLLEVSRVISFGPFRDALGFQEYPPGSLLFDFEQSAPAQIEDDPNGYFLEEERAAYLGTKIIRGLLPEIGSKRQDLDFVLRKSKSRLRRIEKHSEEPFFVSFQGKWMAGTTLRSLKTFSGVPQSEHFARPVASIECIESIGCNLCERACPTGAIRIDRLKAKKEGESPSSMLVEKDCTACGLCLQACPSATPVILHERENQSMSKLTLAWRDSDPFKAGEMATLLNRRGEVLGTARVLKSEKLEIPTQENLKPDERLRYAGEWLIHLEVPSHLLWEARGLRRPKAHASAIDKDFLSLERRETLANKVEVTMNGERRFVREKISISQALFETGQNRSVDQLQCKDGSCGLCEVEVDGLKSLACQTSIRRGMAIKLPKPGHAVKSDELCFCLGVTRSEIEERVKQGKLNTADAAFFSTHVGEGKCHGQLCFASAKRCLIDAGVDAANYVDWRFPWTDWKIDPAKLD